MICQNQSYPSNQSELIGRERRERRIADDQVRYVIPRKRTVSSTAANFHPTVASGFCLISFSLSSPKHFIGLSARLSLTFIFPRLAGFDLARFLPAGLFFSKTGLCAPIPFVSLILLLYGKDGKRERSCCDDDMAKRKRKRKKRQKRRCRNMEKCFCLPAPFAIFGHFLAKYSSGLGFRVGHKSQSHSWTKNRTIRILHTFCQDFRKWRLHLFAVDATGVVDDSINQTKERPRMEGSDWWLQNGWHLTSRAEFHKPKS